MLVKVRGEGALLPICQGPQLTEAPQPETSLVTVAKGECHRISYSSKVTVV